MLDDENDIYDENNELLSNVEPISSKNEEVNEDIDQEEHKTSKYDKKFISKLQRDKYRALQKAKALEEERNQLLAFTQQTFEENHRNREAALIHYDSTIQLKLEKAQEDKLRALEEGDSQKIIQADMALNKAAAEQESLRSWKNQEAYRRQQEEMYSNRQAPRQVQNDSYEQEINEPTQRWLQRNTWFNPNSSDFDPDKAAAVQAFSQSLDVRLHRSGRTSDILSSAYFNKIDNYARQMDEEDYQESTPRGEFSMNNQRSNFVAPVRQEGRMGNTSRQSEKIILTADEKDLARRLGVTPEQFIKSKREDMKNSQLRMESKMRYMR